MKKGTENIFPNTTENYFIDEKKIGIWIDDKPLYRKTFFATNINLQSINIKMSVANKIIDAKGYIITNSNETITLGGGEASYANGTQGQYLYQWIPKNAEWAPGEFYIFGVGTLQSKKVKEYAITLTYTKSSDY